MRGQARVRKPLPLERCGLSCFTRVRAELLGATMRSSSRERRRRTVDLPTSSRRIAPRRRRVPTPGQTSSLFLALGCLKSRRAL
jgi:hypothetical protein